MSRPQYPFANKQGGRLNSYISSQEELETPLEEFADVTITTLHQSNETAYSKPHVFPLYRFPYLSVTASGLGRAGAGEREARNGFSL